MTVDSSKIEEEKVQLIWSSFAYRRNPFFCFCLLFLSFCTIFLPSSKIRICSSNWITVKVAFLFEVVEAVVWPVFWCSRGRWRLERRSRQHTRRHQPAVFLESLIDNRRAAASFQIDSSSSLPGPILEQSSPSLSPCHHPVVQCWLGHSIGKRNSPSLVYCWTTEKWQRKPKKEVKEKRRDFFSKPMMTKTTVLFLLLFLRSQLSCVILSTLFAPIYDNDCWNDRVRHIEGQGLVTSLTTVSLLLSLLTTTSSRFCRNLI